MRRPVALPCACQLAGPHALLGSNRPRLGAAAALKQQLVRRRLCADAPPRSSRSNFAPDSLSIFAVLLRRWSPPFVANNHRCRQCSRYSIVLFSLEHGP